MLPEIRVMVGLFQEVRNLEAGQQAKFEGEWSLYGQNDVDTYYASIAYVSRIRLAAGRVLVADPSPVIAEARKFNAEFGAEQLELEPRSPTKR